MGDCLCFTYYLNLSKKIVVDKNITQKIHFLFILKLFALIFFSVFKNVLYNYIHFNKIIVFIPIYERKSHKKLKIILGEQTPFLTYLPEGL